MDDFFRFFRHTVFKLLYSLFLLIQLGWNSVADCLLGNYLAVAPPHRSWEVAHFSVWLSCTQSMFSWGSRGRSGLWYGLVVGRVEGDRRGVARETHLSSVRCRNQAKRELANKNYRDGLAEERNAVNELRAMQDPPVTYFIKLILSGVFRLTPPVSKVFVIIYKGS